MLPGTKRRFKTIKGSINQRGQKKKKILNIYASKKVLQSTPKTDRTAKGLDKFTILIGESVSPSHMTEAADIVPSTPTPSRQKIKQSVGI